MTCHINTVMTLKFQCHGFCKVPKISMMMTQMSGQEIALFEQGLAYHAPRAKMFQDLRVLQQCLHLVLFNCLAKDPVLMIKGWIKLRVTSLHGLMISSKVTSESM